MKRISKQERKRISVAVIGSNAKTRRREERKVGTCHFLFSQSSPSGAQGRCGNILSAPLRLCVFALKSAVVSKCSGLERIARTGVLVLRIAAITIGSAVGASAADNPSAAAIVKANNAFAVDLYQRERTKPGNLFFSPFSISTALAMTYAGARGETEQEMARVLHFGGTPEQVPAAFAELTRRMEEIGRGQQVKLSVANSLWCQQSYPFTGAFLKLTRDSYGAEARLVDFRNQSETVRQEINSWVAQKTQDKIKDLLQPGQLTPQARLVLCDAVYFKGKWQFQFDPSETKPAPFFVAPGQPKTTSMMSRTLALRSREFDDFYLFALPYTNNVLSMVILLPKAMDGLRAVEQEISGATLGQWLAALDGATETKADVFLPRFELNCRLELARDLSAMGMASAFGPRADFSGMTGKRDLYISDVVHQAMVEVNEEGTEAAAATAVVMRSLALRRNLNPVFRVDHPFIFLLRENGTGSLLFMGRVTDLGK